ncbi:MAG: thiol reductant ABC exporter subunit CydC [Thermoleophilia bacterium]|nr:thiol reductant ABC exporter subunit CydC [Thermoleophilia bacterium]
MSTLVRHAAALGRPVAVRIVLSTVAAVVAVAAAVALLATSGYLISRAAEMPPILLLTVAIVGVRFFALLRAASRYVERILSHDAALRVLVRARRDFLARLVAAPNAALPRSADLLSRAVADVERLQDLFVRVLAPPVVAVVVVLGATTAAAVMVPLGAAVVFGGLAASAMGLAWLGRNLARTATARQQQARAAMGIEVADTVHASLELVAMGQGEAQVARMMAADARLAGVMRADAVGAAVAASLGTAATWGTVIGLAVVGVGAVRDGSLAGVALASLVFIGLAAFEAVLAISPAARASVAVEAAIERLESLPSAAPRDAAHVPTARGPLTLDIDGISVRPAPDAPAAVRNVRLAIAPGEHVALLGPSGCGKSTFTRALVGLLPLDGGTIRVDGIDIRDVDVRALRSRVRLCDQDAHVFATSVAENVRLARPEAADGEVLSALRAVGLGPWLDTLPDGPHTHVGDDGARVSGGQRQRIILARGILADPDLLIVDEPTSHLDHDGARAYVNDLLATRAGAALLMTTHRLSGLEAFDRIVVMRDGRIVEAGTPGELAARGTEYPRMLAAARTVDGAANVPVVGSPETRMTR